MAIELLGGAACALLALGALEVTLHRRRLSRIPTRIHVAGTRGKSSVTRLIAAGLRQAGVVTTAKTTGTVPRMILPDGREVPVFRPRGANIVEQTRIVAAACELNAEAMVIECMALQPELHWVSESKLIRATHGVITNVRADHLDVMGPTEEDVALCLAGMIPVGGVLFTAERKHKGILARACADRATRFVELDDEDLLTVSDDDLGCFEHVEHRDNVALALRVLRELGVEREVALEGMWTARPDPGALTEHEVSFHGRHIVFVNAFAANDPQSTELIWNLSIARHPEVEHVIALFNLRDDRPTRTRQLARETRFWHGAAHVVLIGSGAYHFAREAQKNGLGFDRFTYADHEQVEDMFESVVELCGRRTLVVGMGNIAGPGLGLVRMFRNRRTLEPPLLIGIDREAS
jgi:poly-gamma-glutamate synthase PgsB/CapB